MTKIKHWLFSFIAIVLIPLTLIAALELGLRLFGFGYDTNYVKVSHENGQDVVRENPDFSNAYFPPKWIQRPQAMAFPAEKPSNAYRIFVLGESAAGGWPSPAFSFSRILEVLLHDQFPEVQFEVLNTGITAINSHTIVQIAKDLAPWQGDFFVVYMGNNEVVGPYGPGTVFSPLISNLWLLRTTHFLKTTRIGQLLTRVIALLKGRDTGPAWRGMQLFFEKRVRADDRRMKKVYEYFQKNLEEIVTTAQNSGAPVLITSLGSNIKDIAPLSSLHREDLNRDEKAQWKELYQAGIDRESKGEYQTAVEQFLAAAKIDDDFADLHFRLGRCYWALSQYASAKEHFIKARDLDTLRFRADSRINEIIGNVASNREGENIYFLDVETLLSQLSPHEITDKTYFYEHVHFNFDGNYLLAKEILGQLQTHLPSWILETRKGGSLLTSKECQERLAFTGFNRHEIMDLLTNDLLNKPPFTSMVNYEEVIRRIRDENESLRYYRTFEGLAESAAEYRLALEKNPQDKWIHLNLGRILMRMGDTKEALKQLHLADRLMPHSDPEMILRNFKAKNPAANDGLDPN